MDIKKNTVSAENQMINSSELSFLGNENAPVKILIVGNSITRHGPCTDIGWNNDWGMAASALEKDYVHRLFAMLQESGREVFMRIRQASGWERTFLKEDALLNYQGERDFQADIVIFRLGENVLEEDKPFFKEALRKFIEFICPSTARMIFTTCFWTNVIIDEAICEVAKERKDICVNCCFAIDEKNMAFGKFDHYGVAMHPGDAGMEEIAKAIFEAIDK